MDIRRFVGVVAALGAVGATTVACGPDGTSSTVSAPVTGALSSVAVGTGAYYVHLGDSFAAGSGIDPLVPDSPAMCLRSELNFGQLTAQRRQLRGPAFADVSCGGASTGNLAAAQYFGVPPQVEALGSSTELVTILIGGNDGRLFADAIADCSAVAATDVGGDPCRRAQGNRFDVEIADTVAPALRDAIALIGRRAPKARLLVVGYPRILPPQAGCFPTMRVAVGDVEFLNEVQRRLNRAIADAARVHGATYVDVWAASLSHDACAAPDRRWVEPMVGARTRTTVHPNAAGQRAIADAVAAALR